MTEPRIGDLKHRMRLEHPVSVPDGAGGATISYGLLAELWCELRPRSGGEQGAGEGVQANLAYEVWLRWRSGITTEMRFVLGARVFDIIAVIDIAERRRWLKCLVTERRP